MILASRLVSAAESPQAADSPRNARAFQVAALLAFGVISWFGALQAAGFVDSGRGFSLPHLLGNALLTFLFAVVAVKVGGWSAQRLRLAGDSVSGLLVRTALIAAIFALFLASASGTLQILDRSFAVPSVHAFHGGPPRVAASDPAADITLIGGRALRDTLLAFVAALPLTFLGLATAIRQQIDGTDSHYPRNNGGRCRPMDLEPG